MVVLMFLVVAALLAVLFGASEPTLSPAEDVTGVCVQLDLPSQRDEFHFFEGKRGWEVDSRRVRVGRTYIERPYRSRILIKDTRRSECR